MDTESYIKMMSILVESAKQCTQLAIAALILPVFFLRNILGVPDKAALRPHLDRWLIASWLCLGLSIAVGLLYQIVAADRMSDVLTGTDPNRYLPELPRHLFQIMAGSLYIGLALFIIGILLRGDVPPSHAGTPAEILVPLLGKGTDAWRPVPAKLLGNSQFEILGIVPADESWQFLPGTRVRCRNKMLPDGRVVPVAYEAADA